jgi:dipeptidyl-peptidase-4
MLPFFQPRPYRLMRLRPLTLPGLLLAAAAHAAPAGQCYADLAATRNFTLGLPRHAQPPPDGNAVLFLRSGPRDTTLHLWRFDPTTGTTTELARPTGAQILSVEEKARRERARMSSPALPISPSRMTAGPHWSVRPTA